MTGYMVPNTGQGFRVEGWRDGAPMPYAVVHTPDCAFLGEHSVRFDGLVEGDEVRVRRMARSGRLNPCTFCRPVLLVEGLPPQERAAAGRIPDDTLCGCGHKYVTHALSGGGCYHTHLDDWQTEQRCECTEFVAAEPEPETVCVQVNLADAIADADVIKTALSTEVAPGAFTPGPVNVRLPDESTVLGQVDADGALTVSIPYLLLLRNRDTFVVSMPPYRTASE